MSNTPDARRPTPDGKRGLAAALARYLDAMGPIYSPATVESRRKSLDRFVAWATERDLTRAADITRSHLEHYRRELHRHRKEPTASEAMAGKNGPPLALRTQQLHLNAVRMLFRWLTKEHRILFNPASELDLPRVGKSLPRHVLSASEAERVLDLVKLCAPMGLRDRAILETLYSTGIRRTELSRLELPDLDREHGTLWIRHGKGGTERVVPIGNRAIEWIDRYVQELRPSLLACAGNGERATDNGERSALFLCRDGRPITPAAVSQRVQDFLKRAGFRAVGAAHLFRHTMATLMLEGGADVRYIQAILGHADLSSTEVYTRVSIQKLKAIHTATHPGASLRRRGAETEEETQPFESGDGRRATGDSDFSPDARHPTPNHERSS